MKRAWVWAWALVRGGLGVVAVVVMALLFGAAAAKNPPEMVGVDRLTLSQERVVAAMARSLEEREIAERERQWQRNIEDLGTLQASAMGIPSLTAIPSLRPPPLPEEEEVVASPPLPLQVFAAMGLAGMLALGGLGVGGFVLWRRFQPLSGSSQKTRNTRKAKPLLQWQAPDELEALLEADEDHTLDRTGVKDGWVDARKHSDAVSQATVYLAYNRDIEGEAILIQEKDENPDHLIAYVKLLELYAKRRDQLRFEALLQELRAVSEPIDPEWQRASALAREMGLPLP